LTNKDFCLLEGASKSSCRDKDLLHSILENNINVSVGFDINLLRKAIASPILEILGADSIVVYVTIRERRTISHSL
jgi:hypothetical protein